MKKFLLIVTTTLGLLLIFIIRSNRNSLEGIVTDKYGNPVEDVSVSVDNSGLFSVTDENGYYRIKSVPESLLTLRFNCTGYEPSSATIGLYNEINMTMYYRGETELTEYSLEDLLHMEITANNDLAEKIRFVY